jgi:Fe-S cluster biosynthesis and repair protein YggX
VWTPYAELLHHESATRGADTAPDKRARFQQEDAYMRSRWGDWLKQQTMLINHYGLNVMDPQARAFLTKNMTAFFFKTGTSSDIDTSKKGTISH